MVITPIQTALEIEEYIKTFIRDFDADFYYSGHDYRTIVNIDSKEEQGILIIFWGVNFHFLPEKLKYFIKTLHNELQCYTSKHFPTNILTKTYNTTFAKTENSSLELSG